MIEESNKMVVNVKEKFVKANGELRDVVVSDLHFFSVLWILEKMWIRNWWKRNQEW